MQLETERVLSLSEICTLTRQKDIFLNDREEYIMQQEEKIYKMLYGDASLEEIRELYS